MHTINLKFKPNSTVWMCKKGDLNIKKIEKLGVQLDNDGSPHYSYPEGSFNSTKTIFIPEEFLFETEEEAEEQLLKKLKKFVSLYKKQYGIE